MPQLVLAARDPQPYSALLFGPLAAPESSSEALRGIQSEVGARRDPHLPAGQERQRMRDRIQNLGENLGVNKNIRNLEQHRKRG